MRHIVSFSGGKDSTAMLLRLLEEKQPVDEIVMFDTGWEFPQMHDHVQKVQEYIGREITVLHPHIDFAYWLFQRPIPSRIDRPEEGIKKGEIHRIGNGWPSPMRRWCTREKVQTIDKYCAGAVRYIGFAVEESDRTTTIEAFSFEKRFPLIDWGMTEPDCLQYCYIRGFDWGGLYEHFHRVSCFCCPLQALPELRALRKHFPDLWEKMLDWDSRMGSHNKGFRGYKTVHDLDARFACEDRQHKLRFHKTTKHSWHGGLKCSSDRQLQSAGATP